MFTFLRSLIQQLKPSEKGLYPPCFHCGEPVVQVIELEFAGQTRQLCCHGCLAVLQTIQQAGRSEEYLAHKAQEPT